MKYRKMMKVLKLESDEYVQLKRAFQGGFTHANSFWVGEIIDEKVHSMDFTSSYPYVLLSEKFPMGKARNVSPKSEEEFNRYVDNYCCIFDIELFEVKEKIVFENYISQSRCIHLERGVINNGRVSSADYLATTITEQDWSIIKEYYDFSAYKIRNMKIYSKDYLPINFIKAMLNLYEKKTTLKGVLGKEVEYMNSKEQLNSMYGMCVTDICRPEIVYSDTWEKNIPDFDEAVEKNNKSLKRFLFYPWGVWVTAYARRNLFKAISELGEDYVYSDTDSVKFLNYERHQQFFENYNINVFNRLNTIAIKRGLNFNQINPKTMKGTTKLIGAWDYEGYYTMFKTLGAKRYMVVKDDELTITVSGLNKRTVVPYLLGRYKTFENVFKHFNEGLYIPANYTGKLTHTYVDEGFKEFVRDYEGNIAQVEEKTFIHLEPADYSLDIASAFAKFIRGRKDETY